jgi:hypothetical protein
MKMELSRTVLFYGSREFDNFPLIYQIMDVYPKTTLILNGGCRGADQLAEEAARRQGKAYLTIPAWWDEFGKSAGHVRNVFMQRYARPHEGVGFVSQTFTPGTRDMCSVLRMNNVPYQVFDATGSVVSRCEAMTVDLMSLVCD